MLERTQFLRKIQLVFGEIRHVALGFTARQQYLVKWVFQPVAATSVRQLREGVDAIHGEFLWIFRDASVLLATTSYAIALIINGIVDTRKSEALR